VSAIAKNSSITLLTGVPGNGKSLRAVWYMAEAVKAGEQVYACNINGLKIPGVHPWDDPTKWEELPAGAILVVDEAQKFWRAGLTEMETDPVTQKQRAVVPKNIQAMETIRHSGIRLIVITQSPALIHANIRALIGLHEHLVRQNGAPGATVYRRSRVIDNVRSEKALAAEDHESWSYPTECYELYTSAEVHTVKRTIPSKYKRAAILGAIAVLLVVGVGALVSHSIYKDKEKGAALARQGATQGATPQAIGAPGDQRPKYANPGEYAQAHLPRFASMPWTAPVYDGRGVTADPQVLCMSSAAGLDANGKQSQGGCHCVTEQNTVYEMSEPECRRVARIGPAYNPYRERRAEVQAQQQGVGFASGPAPGQPTGSVIGGQQMASYGDIGAAPPQKIYGSM